MEQVQSCSIHRLHYELSSLNVLIYSNSFCQNLNLVLSRGSTVAVLESFKGAILFLAKDCLLHLETSGSNSQVGQIMALPGLSSAFSVKGERLYFTCVIGLHPGDVYHHATRSAGDQPLGLV